MTYASQFGGGGPVGTQVFMPDIGTAVTMADNSVWLRAGTLTTTVSAPQLAAIKNYQVLGTIATTPIPAGVSVSALASNGSGVLVAGNLDYTSIIHQSADNGVTWTAVSLIALLGPYGQVAGVAYGGGRFVAVVDRRDASNNDTFYLIYSTNGTTWTVGATLPGSGAYCSPGLKSIIYSVNKFVIAYALNSSSNLATAGCCLSTSTDGSTILSTNNGTATYSNMNSLGQANWGFTLISSGATVICYPAYYNGTANGYAVFTYSLNSGATWSTTYPGTFLYSSSNIQAAFNGTALLMIADRICRVWDNFAAAPATFTTIPLTSILKAPAPSSGMPCYIWSTGVSGTHKTYLAISGSAYMYRLTNDLKSAMDNTTTQMFNSTSANYLLGYIPVNSTSNSLFQNASLGSTATFDVDYTTYNYCGLTQSSNLPTGGNYYQGLVWYVRAS